MLYCIRLVLFVAQAGGTPKSRLFIFMEEAGRYDKVKPLYSFSLITVMLMISVQSVATNDCKNA